MLFRSLLAVANFAVAISLSAQTASASNLHVSITHETIAEETSVKSADTNDSFDVSEDHSNDTSDETSSSGIILIAVIALFTVVLVLNSSKLKNLWLMSTSLDSSQMKNVGRYRR